MKIESSIRILLMLLVAFLPLIMHIHVNPVPHEVQEKFPQYLFEFDIFNWWKNAVLYSVTAVITLLWLFKSNGQKSSLNLFYRICLWSYFWLVHLSAISSKYLEVSWYGMSNYLEGGLAILCYCLLFIASYFAFYQKPDLTVLDKALSILTVVMFGVCCIQFFNSNIYSIPVFKWLIFGGLTSTMTIAASSWPLYGTIMNSNMLGTLMTLTYPFFLARGNWPMTLLSVLIAVGAQSRGAWVGMAIGTIYIIAHQGIPKLTRVVVPALFFALGIGLMHFNVQGRLRHFTFTDSGRFYVWQETLAMIQPPNIIGAGPGVYALEFPQDDVKSKIANGWSAQTVIDRPHNFYLQVLYGSGLLSLLAVLAIFGGFFRDCYLTRHSQDLYLLALSASVLSYLLNMFFTDSCTSVAPLFWIMLGIGVSLVQYRLRLIDKFRGAK